MTQVLPRLKHSRTALGIGYVQPHAEVGSCGLLEQRRADPADQERTAAFDPVEQERGPHPPATPRSPHAGFSPRLSSSDWAQSRPSGREREERISHGARDGQDQGFHLARPPAHLCIVADDARRLTPRGRRASRPSRPPDGDALRASVTRVFVRGNRPARCADLPKGQKKGKVPPSAIALGRKWWILRKEMAPQPGLEPGTLRLTAGCSTIELLRNSGLNAGGKPRF